MILDPEGASRREAWPHSRSTRADTHSRLAVVNVANPQLGPTAHRATHLGFKFFASNFGSMKPASAKSAPIISRPRSVSLDLRDLNLQEVVPNALIGGLMIGGISFYVEAIEVKGNGNEPGNREASMTAVNENLQDRIDAIAGFDAGGDRVGYSTVLHDGSHYFVIAYPSQS